jgi:hypothetical protein
MAGGSLSTFDMAGIWLKAAAAGRKETLPRVRELPKERA